MIPKVLLPLFEPWESSVCINVFILSIIEYLNPVLIGFMTTHDRHDAMAWLPLFAKFFRRIEGNIACAALDAWGLVLSCLDSKEMLECSKSAMPTLQALLESSSLDVLSSRS